jgi:hypothetical protein
MTQHTVISVVSRISGSAIPSMPRWYRAWMTSIQSLLTVNCSEPVVS